MAEKVRISKKEIIKMIKEEYHKKELEVSLKTQLNEVNAKINNLLKEDEDTELDEVTADGETKVKSTAWTGDKNGDTKFKAKFEKKGSHFLEEEDLENEEGLENEENFEDEEEVNDEDIEEILKKLADAINNKVEDTVDEKIEEKENDTEDFTGEENEEEDENEEENGEENKEEETIDEQDGHSVATEKSTDGPKSKTPYTETQTTLSESFIKRQQLLAGIRKSEK